MGSNSSSFMVGRTQTLYETSGERSRNSGWFIKL